MIFSFRSSPCQKKVLLILSKLLTVVLGSKKTDMWYIGELFKLEDISVDLPAIDKFPPFQTSNLLLLFSIKGNQSHTFNLLGLTSTSKYFIGNRPTWQLNISAYICLKLSSSFIIRISLLLKLILRPANISNRYNKSFMCIAPSTSCFKKTMVSSAYWRIATPLGTIWLIKPVINPFDWAFYTILVKQSATKLKSIGDKGSPCLTPL